MMLRSISCVVASSTCASKDARRKIETVFFTSHSYCNAASQPADSRFQHDYTKSEYTAHMTSGKRNCVAINNQSYKKNFNGEICGQSGHD